MAGHDDEENFFDDDDLDTLPHDALVELENNAIQFTQAQTPAAGWKAAPSSDYGDDFEDEDLDVELVIDESRSTPAIIAPLRRGLPGQATQQEQFRQQRYGTISNPFPVPHLVNLQRSNPPPRFNQLNQIPPPIAIPLNDSVVARQGSQPSATAKIKVDSLQRQIEELTKERNTLKNELNAKSGEIAIVRSKQEKTVKEFERELIALRRLNEDKLVKQQKALDAARIAEKNAATERDFIKRDLAEESERVRRLNKAKELEKRNDVVTTPKKKKVLPHRDGFDDDEIEILSPSKISPSKFQKRHGGSPSRAGKRKRKIVNSPAGALEVIQPDEPHAADTNAPILDEAILAKLNLQDNRFDFIGTMLNHRINAHHLRTLEELGKHAFPSSPKESLQSLILGEIPALGLKKQSKGLSVEFCELLISLWAKCMEEKYIKPIYLLIDMLTFALELHTSSIAPHIVDPLLSVTQLTVKLVIIPRYKCSEPEDYAEGIEVTPCMHLLYLTALGCMSEHEHITHFWKEMLWDFVLYMLSTNQAEEDYSIMMRLLSTSVMKDSFGTIPEDNSQAFQVKYVLDRLTYPIVDAPYLPKSTEKFDDARHYRYRLQILQILTSMTRSPFASRAIAEHPLAIGRLVCLVSDQLDTLYDYKSGHEECARLISLAMKLLYHLVTKYENIDMQKKLAVVHGGSQKYLLCLSRLNFSDDDLVLESGIDADVAACALEMLELAVTPEEGDAIHSAFSAS